MSADLENLRRRALQERADRNREEDLAQQKLAALVAQHLPEWVKVIDASMASKIGGSRWQFHRSDWGHQWGGWESKQNGPKPHLDLSGIEDFDGYAEELQRTLGDPFRVSIFWTNKDGDPGFDISWR